MEGLIFGILRYIMQNVLEKHFGCWPVERNWLAMQCNAKTKQNKNNLSSGNK